MWAQSPRNSAAAVKCRGFEGNQGPIRSRTHRGFRMAAGGGFLTGWRRLRGIPSVEKRGADTGIEAAGRGRGKMQSADEIRHVSWVAQSMRRGGARGRLGFNQRLRCYEANSFAISVASGHPVSSDGIAACPPSSPGSPPHHRAPRSSIRLIRVSSGCSASLSLQAEQHLHRPAPR